MSESQATSRPFEQTAHQRAEINALHRMLDLSEGTFSLSIAVCNSPVLRDHIINYVKGETPGIEVVHIGEETLDIFDFVRGQIPENHPRAVFVAGIERPLAGESKDRVLQALNVSREQWRSICECPIVFWLPEHVMSLLMTEARDLWSWVSHTFEFVSEQATALAGQQDSFAGDLVLAGNLDVHEKHFRIAELDQRITDIGDQPEAQLRQNALVWLRELAYLYYSIGQLKKAEEVLQQGLRWVTPDDREALSRFLQQIGAIHENRGDYRQALRFYEQSREINEQLGDRAGVSRSLHAIGNIHYSCGDYDQALQFYEQSRRIKEELGNRAGLAGSLHQIGMIHQARGNYQEALRLYEQSAAIAEERGDRDGLSLSLHNIGNVYHLLGDYEQALRFYEQSREIKEKLGDRAGVSASLHNIGIIHQARGDYDKALQFYEQSRKISEEVGDRANLSKSLHQIGTIYQLRGDHKEALHLYEQAQKSFEEMGDRVNLAHSHGQMGRLYVETGKHGEALGHFLFALAIFCKIGSPAGLTVLNDLRELRQAWGPAEFDNAWRQKIGQDPPLWLAQNTESKEEQPKAE